MRTILCYLLQAYFVVLIAYVILSWVPRPPQPIMPLVRGLSVLVDPLLRPLRRVIPPLQLGGSGVGLDLSILVLFFGLIIIQGAVC